MNEEIITNEFTYRINNTSRFAVTISKFNNKVVADSLKMTFGSEATRLTFMREDEKISDVKITYGQLFLLAALFETSEAFRALINYPSVDDLLHAKLSEYLELSKTKTKYVPRHVYKEAAARALDPKDKFF